MIYEALDEELPEEEDDDAQEDRYLTFPLDHVNYGIAIEKIREIVGIQEISRLPNMPPFIKGLINLRGQVIPVIDVRLRFHLLERTYDDRTCIVVVESHERLVGLIVDTVAEVLYISKDQIEPPTSIQKGPETLFIAGMGKVGKEVRVLLDLGRVLYGENLDKHPSVSSN